MNILAISGSLRATSTNTNLLRPLTDMRISRLLIIGSFIGLIMSCARQSGQHSVSLAQPSQITMDPKKHTVLKDSLGRVLTLFDYGKKNQLYVMGTPYWAYPTWQAGTVQLSEEVTPMACQVAYNVVSNDLLFRFNDDQEVYAYIPARFSIGPVQFVRHFTPGNYPTYYRVLYSGKAQLLENFRRKVIRLNKLPFDKAYTYLIGRYSALEENYFIQLPGHKMKSVQLTRHSVLNVLKNNVDTIHLPPGPTLTVQDITNALADYDARQDHFHQ